ncbi:MAG: response regulator transcription factor [Chloroflexi bacterium]|nr:response regulator transcription factor [Chloroflexota bacterium]
MSRIRVMVVDDHEVVRTGLAAILEPESDLEVVGEAGSAEEAVRKVPLLEPKVVLMDVRMGEMSGIEACRAIKSAHPQVAVLMLTSFGEEEAVLSAVIAGASGFLLKNVGRADLLKALRAVARGEALLDPAMTSRVLARLKELTLKEQAHQAALLSEREKEVVALVAQGLTNKEIANRLVISENTARNHVSRILEKLGLTRRSEAAVFAAQHGLLKKQDPQEH